VNRINNTAKSFNYEWEMSKHFDTQFDWDNIVSVFLNETGMPKEWFKGKHCLDVGCGMGRWMSALKQLDADVIGTDISEEAVKMSKKYGRVIKSDLFNLQLAEQFDFVICDGVLQCLEDSRKGFHELLKYCKPDGIVHISVYEWKNPLKLFLTNLLRKRVTKKTLDERWEFSGKLANLVVNRVMYAIVNFFILASKSQFTNFDNYSTPINHYFKEEEVIKWFEEEGLRWEIITPNGWKIYNNIFMRFLKGKNNGKIRFRGIK